MRGDGGSRGRYSHSHVMYDGRNNVPMIYQGPHIPVPYYENVRKNFPVIIGFGVDTTIYG